MQLCQKQNYGKKIHFLGSLIKGVHCVRCQIKLRYLLNKKFSVIGGTWADKWVICTLGASVRFDEPLNRSITRFGYIQLTKMIFMSINVCFSRLRTLHVRWRTILCCYVGIGRLAAWHLNLNSQRIRVTSADKAQLNQNRTVLSVLERMVYRTFTWTDNGRWLDSAWPQNTGCANSSLDLSKWQRGLLCKRVYFEKKPGFSTYKTFGK